LHGFAWDLCLIQSFLCFVILAESLVAAGQFDLRRVLDDNIRTVPDLLVRSEVRVHDIGRRIRIWQGAFSEDNTKIRYYAWFRLYCEVCVRKHVTPAKSRSIVHGHLDQWVAFLHKVGRRQVFNGETGGPEVKEEVVRALHVDADLSIVHKVTDFNDVLILDEITMANFYVLLGLALNLEFVPREVFSVHEVSKVDREENGRILEVLVDVEREHIVAVATADIVWKDL
jgi:hypothetical protein